MQLANVRRPTSHSSGPPDSIPLQATIFGVKLRRICVHSRLFDVQLRRTDAKAGCGYIKIGDFFGESRCGCICRLHNVNQDTPAT